MPRTAPAAPGVLVFHVINRGVGKQQLFFCDEDYRAFEKAVAETLEKRPMRLLSYCLMPTAAELQSLRRSCNRGTPYGRPQWIEQTVRKLALEATTRKPGRPRKL